MTNSGNQTFRHIFSVPTMLLHIVLIPIFFLGFVLLYESSWMIDFLGMGMDANRLVLNVLMLMCILMGVLCASRIPMTVFRHQSEHDLTECYDPCHKNRLSALQSGLFRIILNACKAALDVFV